MRIYIVCCLKEYVAINLTTKSYSHVQIYKTLSLIMTVNQDQRTRNTHKKLEERQTFATHFGTRYQMFESRFLTFLILPKFLFNS